MTVYCGQILLRAVPALTEKDKEALSYPMLLNLWASAGIEPEYPYSGVFLESLPVDIGNTDNQALSALMAMLLSKSTYEEISIPEILFLVLSPFVYGIERPDPMWVELFSHNVIRNIMESYSADTDYTGAINEINSYKSLHRNYVDSEHADDFTRHPLFQLAIKRFHMTNTVAVINPWRANVAAWDALKIIHYFMGVILDCIESNNEEPTVAETS